MKGPALAMALLASLPAALIIASEQASADGVTTMTATLPTKRYGTSAVWDGTNAYIFGGADAGWLNQIVRYNPASNTVATMTATLPTGRYRTSAVWDGTNAYIFGGEDASSLLNQIVRYNPSTNTVTAMTATLPTGRYGTSAVWDGTNAYVFGGNDGSSLNQIVRYNPSTNTVTAMTATLPTGRYHASAVWDGTNAYVFGGIGPGRLNEIVRYNAGTDTVTTMSATLPTVRYWTSAAWDGTNAYVFGGTDGISNLKQIIRYAPNKPPVAVIAAVADAECDNGGQTVTLDGTGSFDPDGDAITFAWSAPGITFNEPTSATPSALFPLGSTTVTLNVTDSFGASGTATATVRVVDSLPPAVSIARPVAGASYVNDIEITHGATQAPILAVGPLTIIANAEDQCGVVRVDFASTNGAVGSDATAPYTFLSNPAPTASGPATVTATVHDLEGHAASAAVSFMQVGSAV